MGGAAGAPRAEAAEGPLASTATCEGLVVVRHKLVCRVLLHHAYSLDALAVHIVAVHLILALAAIAVAIVVTVLIPVIISINVLLTIHLLLIYCVSMISSPCVINIHIISVSINLINLVHYLAKVFFLGLGADRDWRFVGVLMF